MHAPKSSRHTLLYRSVVSKSLPKKSQKFPGGLCDLILICRQITTNSHYDFSLLRSKAVDYFQWNFLKRTADLKSLGYTITNYLELFCILCKMISKCKVLDGHEPQATVSKSKNEYIKQSMALAEH